jgi:ABC-type bacteriocin/lantibiotic exporter with double-glycine peptidase domain
VSDFQAAWGMKKKLDQLGRSERVAFVLRPDGSLDDLPTPCVASTDYSFWFDHMICILDIDERTVLVADPLSGHKRWIRSEFEAEWLGVAIVVRPAEQ